MEAQANNNYVWRANHYILEFLTVSASWGLVSVNLTVINLGFGNNPTQFAQICTQFVLDEYVLTNKKCDV